MDLLFKRYASPFLLLDQMICNRRFSDFVYELVDKTNEEFEWEFYIHRHIERSFEDFRKSLRNVNHSHKIEKQTDENLETIISDSQDILNTFIPD